MAEANETFTVQLANPSGGATLGSPSTATVTIVDGSNITIGQTSVLTGQGSGDANTLQGIKASLGQTATIQSMSIYFKAVSGYVRLSIYDDKGNYPGTLRAQTAQFAPTAGWNTQNVTVPVTLSTGTYWLIWQTDNNSAGVAYAPGTSAYIVTGYAYGAPPAAFPSGGKASPDESIYATLNSAGAGSAPTVATPASANPNPVPGRTTTLSVVGADDGGEANLTYTWATTGKSAGGGDVRCEWHECSEERRGDVHQGGELQLPGDDSRSGQLDGVEQRDGDGDADAEHDHRDSCQRIGGDRRNAGVLGHALDQFGVPLASQPAFSWTATGGGR